MLVFPQLATGAVGQYPIVKRRRARTVVNEAADGVQVKLADAAAAAVEWDLAFSGFWRVVNTGAGGLAISQTINAPGWFTYAFGMQARSSGGATVLLRRTAGVDTQSLSFALGAEWRGIGLSGSFGGAEEAVTFGIEVAPGESVDMREIQAEAQAGMSGYKKTFSPCGVYSQARFRDDALEFTAEAPDQHSCLARIRARG
jgi:hypothetical protein